MPFVDWEEMPLFTAVPDSFIQKYLPDAPGDHVKVFIYLLMSSHKEGIDASPEHMSKLLGIPESVILAALKYWEKLRLLKVYYESGKVAGIKITINASSKPKEEHRLSQSRVKKLINDNDDAKTLQYVTEKYLGRPLTFNELSTLLYFMDELHLPVELCEYLVEYCISKGHPSIRYIEKVGLAWHKEGYRTVEEAKAASTSWSRIHFDVLKAFGITNRNPIKKEQDYISKWYNEFCFSLEIISEACSITLSQTGKQSFEYADSILTRWHDAGVKTLNDIKKMNEEFRSKKASHPASNSKNRFLNFEQRNDDLDELERALDKQFADNGGH